MAGEDIVLQSSLGRTNTNYKNTTNMSGKLYLCKVTKVHHKSNTVDVEIVKSRSKLTSSEQNEGNLGVRITVSTAHFDALRQTVSGVVEPYQKDQLVLVGFVDNNGTSPVILGSFHDTYTLDATKTIYPNRPLTQKYPLDIENDLDDKREGLKYLRVTPSQLYHKIDGIGGVEVSLPSTSFLKVDIDDRDVISDVHGGFDHRDLSEKDPYRFMQTRKGVEEETQFPVNMLFVHRSSFYDENTTWTKFFLNREGLFRFSRDNNDETLTFVEVDKQGKLRIQRQMDSSMLPNTGGSDELEAKDYVYFEISEDGECVLRRKDEKQEITVESLLDLKKIENRYKDDIKKITIEAVVDEGKAQTKYEDENSNLTVSSTVSGGGASMSVSTPSGTNQITVSPSGEISLINQAGATFTLTPQGNMIVQVPGVISMSDSLGEFRRCTC